MSRNNLSKVSALPDTFFEFEREISDKWVLLWSARGNCFHIERAKHMLQSNRRAYAEDRSMDYVPIFIGTDDACHSLAGALRGTIRMRNADRGLLRDV